MNKNDATELFLPPKLAGWVNPELKRQGVARYRVSDVMADADTRRYYRLAYAGGSVILMHILSSPKERVSQVLQTTEFFAAGGLRVPALSAHNQSLGLILQEDFGTTPLWQVLRPADTKNDEITGMPKLRMFYEEAVRMILRIQHLDGSHLPSMNKQHLISEMQIFSDWFLGKWLGNPNTEEQKMLEDYYLYLAESIVAAPQVCLHRDFHSHNLFIVGGKGKGIADGQDMLGMLDYQGAMVGHFCYDLASLLNDAYTLLSVAEAERLIALFCAEVSVHLNMDKLGKLDHNRIIQQLNLITIQRFLKVCGQFVRLSKQEQKDKYIAFLPTAAARIESALAGPLPDDKRHRDFSYFWQHKVRSTLKNKYPS